MGLLGAAALGADLGLAAAPVLAEIKRSPAGHVEVRGAEAMLPFARLAVEGYMGEHPDQIVTAAGGGSRRGFKSVLVGTADIALVTTEIPDDLDKLATDRKIKLERKEIYRDAVFVVVHPKNPINNITIGQLRDVYRGVLTNWKDVGGKDAPIVLVNHEGHEAAFDTFKHRVLGDGAVVTPRALTIPYRDFAKAMVENAIGYIGKRGLGSLKAISVDGVAASAETLASGKYVIQRHLSVAYRADAPPAVTRLVDYFLAADKGQAIVRARGDVPVSATHAGEK